MVSTKDGGASWMSVTGLISLIFAFGVSIAAASAEERVFRIYLDADRSENYPSARAIEMGVRAAFSHEELHPDGVRFEFVARDHRGNAKRSRKTIQSYLNDDAGLAVIGGKHSPPYLTYKDWVNESGALMLLPWSAAGPVTRTDAPVNWFFRASVDDTKAGAFLVDQSLRVAGCQRPAVILLNSGWGRANRKTILKAFEDAGLSPPHVSLFDAHATQTDMRISARELEGAGVDCILLVGGWRMGVRLVQEVAALSEPMRIFSHWGIMGGSFVSETTHEARSRVDLQFIQTCLPFGRQDLPPLRRAEAAANVMFPDEFRTLDELPSAVGFAHAYDLGLILLTALRQTDLSGNIATVRARVRDQLENLREPVPGLLKTYDAPFSSTGFDSHDALGASDLCLARYDADGRVTFVTRSGDRAVSQ